MNCKKNFAPLACGIALSAIALSSVAKADDMMSSTPMTSTPMTETSMMPATSMAPSMMTMPAPTQVSGTVTRYYTDRIGLVTAMDLQTATGTEFVHFSPGMAQRVVSVAPVGGMATVYVSGSPTTRWDLVGFGTSMPSPNVMIQPAPSDLEVLESTPFISNGAKQITVSGNLLDTVVTDKGEVVGLILSDSKSSMMMEGMTANMAMPMNGMTLVRIGREFRHNAPGERGSARVAPLFKGAYVTVKGYPEAPRYGVISTFQNRIDASGLDINGRNVGAIGIQKLAKSSKGKMMNSMMMDGNTMPSGTMTAEQTHAMNMGYSTYTMSGTPMMGGMTEMGDTSTMSTTTTTTSTTTTTPSM